MKSCGFVPGLLLSDPVSSEVLGVAVSEGVVASGVN